MNDLSCVNTPEAPKAIGPYSQAVIAGGFIFVSGQLPIDPKTSKIVSEDIREQTNMVLENIKSILKEKNIGLDKVVKAEVYLKDLSDFKIMNEVYTKHFTKDPKPARHAFEVAKLPLDVKVEIACVAFLD